jgi:hypothetical protein
MKTSTIFLFILLTSFCSLFCQRAVIDKSDSLRQEIVLSLDSCLNRIAEQKKWQKDVVDIKNKLFTYDSLFQIEKESKDNVILEYKQSIVQYDSLVNYVISLKSGLYNAFNAFVLEAFKKLPLIEAIRITDLVEKCGNLSLKTEENKVNIPALNELNTSLINAGKSTLSNLLGLVILNSKLRQIVDIEISNRLEYNSSTNGIFHLSDEDESQLRSMFLNKEQIIRVIQYIKLNKE